MVLLMFAMFFGVFIGVFFADKIQRSVASVLSFVQYLRDDYAVKRAEPVG